MGGKDSEDKSTQPAGRDEEVNKGRKRRRTGEEAGGGKDKQREGGGKDGEGQNSATEENVPVGVRIKLLVVKAG